MKRTKISGQIVLSESEINKALFEYAKNSNAFLQTVLDSYLRRHHKVSVQHSKLLKDKEGKIIARVDLEQIDDGINNRLKQLNTNNRISPSGYVKRNLGFYHELVNYLESQRKRKKKSISIDHALEVMKKKFPTMDSRRFSIYVRDKRQQSVRGFGYDSLRREITF